MFARLSTLMVVAGLFVACGGTDEDLLFVDSEWRDVPTQAEFWSLLEDDFAEMDRIGAIYNWSRAGQAARDAGSPTWSFSHTLTSVSNPVLVQAKTEPATSADARQLITHLRDVVMANADPESMTIARRDKESAIIRRLDWTHGNVNEFVYFISWLK